MSYTAQQVKDLIESSEVQGEPVSLIDFWYGEVSDVDIKNGPRITLVDTGGGEGDGAPIWIILSVGDQLFRANGYYSSWDSSEMDGQIEEVKAVQVNRTEYEAV